MIRISSEEKSWVIIFIPNTVGEWVALIKQVKVVVIFLKLFTVFMWNPGNLHLYVKLANIFS